MNLRFIIGRAGTGKTTTCQEEIREHISQNPMGMPLCFLVPEQATFQMEYTLATTPNLGGLFNAQVFSFRRLAWKVLNETGGAAKVPIGELGKRMTLRRLLEESKDDLQLFSSLVNRPGFADKLARSIGEMKIYGIKPANLAQALEVINQEDSLLTYKLRDFQQLYNQLEDFLADRFVDPDDYLNLLADKIKNSPDIDNTEFWIDGFTGFTPQEFSVLENIMRYAQRVNITIGMDSELITKELTEEELFYPIWETYQELLRLANRAGAKIELPLILDSDSPKRFFGSTDLAHLEKCYFQYPTEVYSNQPENIQLIAAANRRAEVEATAGEIISLARDQGYRWRDIAVLVRDLASYHDLIKTIFTDYNIPFFIDYKRPVMHHPLIELIRSSLEICYRNWTYEPVFRFLKTDLAMVNRNQIDVLENYVLAHGIKGAKWFETAPWNYRLKYSLGEKDEATNQDIDDLEIINTYRQMALEGIKNFSEAMHSAKNVRGYCLALYQLLEELEVADSLNSWADNATKEGELEKSREHRQIWAGVINLLDELVESLGEDEISPEEFSCILDSGFESMRLGMIPPGLDQILVGTLDRSKNPDLKALFILGVNEGVLPSRVTEDGIFNDHDRQRLDQVGITLAPGSRRKVFDEQYLLYKAISGASSMLWLSYPMADEEGKAMTASPAIGRMKELFPDIKERIVQIESDLSTEDGQLYLASTGKALTYLNCTFREAKAGYRISSLWFDVYNWFLEQEKLKPFTERIVPGLFFDNHQQALNSNISRELYQLPLRASVSRIEKYRSCPFAHFASYGLHLKERPVFRLAAPDMGELFHEALKSFVDYINEKSLDWLDISDEGGIEISNKILDELSPKIQNEILLSSARYRYITGKLKKIINRAVLMLLEHARRSTFRPIGLELSFGPGGQLPPVVIKLSDNNTLQLAGRIDRVDAAKVDDQYYLRVVDYKSGNMSLDLENVYYGLSLQLLTYLHVVLTYSDRLNCKQGQPGGILYFTVQDPLIRASGPLNEEEISKMILKALKMQGYLLAEPEIIKSMDNHLQTGFSDLFNIALNKDGSLRANSKAISSEQFNKLRGFLEKSFMEAGEEIISGQVGIEPYKKRDVTPCGFCDFKALCKFDQLLEGNHYRNLTSISKDDFWKMIGEGD